MRHHNCIHLVLINVSYVSHNKNTRMPIEIKGEGLALSGLSARNDNGERTLIASLKLSHLLHQFLESLLILGVQGKFLSHGFEQMMSLVRSAHRVAFTFARSVCFPPGLLKIVLEPRLVRSCSL